MKKIITQNQSRHEAGNQTPPEMLTFVAQDKNRICPSAPSAFHIFFLCSWHVSVHGAGTVRYWAAMNLSIAQCRHNVSARDGGFPASRRSRAGAISVRAPLALAPNALPTT
jgi:hypothetical protein